MYIKYIIYIHLKIAHANKFYDLPCKLSKNADRKID